MDDSFWFILVENKFQGTYRMAKEEGRGGAVRRKNICKVIVNG
jgi:hypothetical protein